MQENEHIKSPFLEKGLEAYMLKFPHRHKSVEFEPFTKDGEHYLFITVPLLSPEDGFLVVTKNITQTDKMLDKIMQNIIIINLSAIFLILFYALFLSRMLQIGRAHV